MSEWREIRKRLGLKQREIAQKLGRSVQQVQNYERGHEPSPEIRKIYRSLEEAYGIGTDADDFIADAEGTSFVPVEVRPKEKHERWVGLLTEILNSGHSVAIGAVQQNLEAFSRLVRVDSARNRAGASGQKRGRGQSRASPQVPKS